MHLRHVKGLPNVQVNNTLAFMTNENISVFSISTEALVTRAFIYFVNLTIATTFSQSICYYFA